MRKRRFEAAEPELMDRPDASPVELAAALKSLRGFNRYFGSYRIVSHFLRRWVKRGDQLRVLDLATGSADIPRLIAEHARKVRAEVEIVAVDFQPSTVELARRLSAGYPEIACECADVLTYSVSEPFDMVICSLALHHFSNEDAVRLLRRCRELSRRFVLVTDLRRGFLAAIGVYLLTAFVFDDRMTRADGRTSAKRSFSVGELRGLAFRAGWENFEGRKFRFARQAIWLEAAAAR
jgi:SAM-dependent methyltransferase